MIQRGFECWMNRTSADLDRWAATHGTDSATLRAVRQIAHQIERRCGASTAAKAIWRFFNQAREHR
jgi:hypothetical protein